MSATPDSSTVFDVGARLRALRKERRLSIRKLAAAAGISPNALSQIERSVVSPSVTTISRVATALNVPLARLFEDDHHQPVVLVKAHERTKLPFARGVIELLGGRQFSGCIEAFFMKIGPGGNSGPEVLIHAGDELVWCLRGTLEYTIEHQVYTLEAGDNVLLAAHLRHQWRNPSRKTTAEVLVVIAPFEEEARSTMVRRLEEIPGA